MKRLLNNIFRMMILIVPLSACNNHESSTEKNSKPVSPSKSDAPAMIMAGRDLFDQKCASCHGEDGNAGIGGAANLQTSTLDEATMILTIKNGRNAMPAFGETLSANEIQEVMAYTKSLKQ